MWLGWRSLVERSTVSQQPMILICWNIQLNTCVSEWGWALGSIRLKCQLVNKITSKRAVEHAHTPLSICYAVTIVCRIDKKETKILCVLNLRSGEFVRRSKHSSCAEQFQRGIYIHKMNFTKKSVLN